MKITGEITQQTWGTTIQIQDDNGQFQCHVNPYGNSNEGRPSDKDKEVADFIVESVTNYPDLKNVLEHIIRSPFPGGYDELKAWVFAVKDMALKESIKILQNEKIH